MVLYTLSGWGHYWPGSALAERMGSRARGFDAASVIWGFFASHRRQVASLSADPESS